MSEADMSEAEVPIGRTSVGLMTLQEIVDQVVHILTMRQAKSIDVFCYTDEQWMELFATAFGSTIPAVRLAVFRSYEEYGEQKT